MTSSPGRILLGGDVEGLREVLERPEAVAAQRLEEEHDLTPRDPPQFAEAGLGLGPVMDGQHRHRRVERRVRERQGLSHSSHDAPSPSPALPEHRRRGLDRHDQTIARLVVPGTCPHVHDRAAPTEARTDLRGDPRILAPGLRVRAPDALVEGTVCGHPCTIARHRPDAPHPALWDTREARGGLLLARLGGDNGEPPVVAPTRVGTACR